MKHFFRPPYALPIIMAILGGCFTFLFLSSIPVSHAKQSSKETKLSTAVAQSTKSDNTPSLPEEKPEESPDGMTIRERMVRFETELKALRENNDARFNGVDKQFAGVDKQFEAIDKRFDDMYSAMMGGFSLLGALLCAVIGVVVYQGNRAARVERVSAGDGVSLTEINRLKSMLTALQEAAKSDVNLRRALEHNQLL